MPKKTNAAIVEYQNKDGETRYKFRLYLGINPLTGAKFERNRKDFKSYVEANAEYKRLIKVGIPTTVTTKLTFAQVYEEWLQMRAKSIKPATVYAIKSRWKNHIENYLGKYLIHRLSPAILQKYANDLPTRFVNYKTILNYVHSILDYAVRMGYVESNQMDRITIPQNAVREQRDTQNNFLENDEVKKFLTAAKQVGPREYTYFVILAYCGLRMGEGLALKFSDFTPTTLHVQRTITRDEDGSTTVGSTKSYAGDRFVPITPEVWAIVQDYQQQPQVLHIDTEYMFYGRTGKPLPAGTARSWLTSVYLILGPDFKRITLHGLRHSFASRLYEADPTITPRDVATMLGDKTLTTAVEVYTHMLKDGKQKVSTAINQIKLI